MARPGWYSDHPAACTCVGCGERGGARTRVGSSFGNRGRQDGSGRGSGWKWLAAIVVAALVGVVIYIAATGTDGGQPAPANTAPANDDFEARAPVTLPSPSPAPDVRARTGAAIAATVEALSPTSTPSTASLNAASNPTPTPTRIPVARAAVSTPTKPPTIPTRAPTSAPAARPSPTPTTLTSLRDFTNGPWLAQEDPRLALSIEALGWMRDGIDSTEAKALQDLLYIAVTSRAVLASLVSLDWIRDGIGDDEAAAIGWIDNMAATDVMSAVVALDWVRDGVDDIEAAMMEDLSYIAYEDTGLGLTVVSMGWVRDGIDKLEARAIEELSYIAYEDATSAARIVGMPFLETIEPPDVAALESLGQLAASWRRAFYWMMTHAAVGSGISDDLAPIVATLHGVAETNPDLVDTLLHPAKVTVERRTITLPLAGEVDLAIIRTGPGAPRSMDLLEYAVRGVERLMGLPLPTRYVGLLYENAVSGPVAGTNFGTHVAILPEYDVDDGSREAGFAGSHVAHEVAHYYWSGNADWVDEGAADLMASIVDGARTGRPVGVTNRPCAYASTIADLEKLGVSQTDDEFECNYALGERLFVDLYRTLGDDRFLRAFRDLYLASEMEDDENDPGTSVGIEHVRDAFRTDEGAERAVIARWDDGTEPYDRSGLDYAPVDPSLPAINGRVELAYVVTERDGPPAAVFSARDVDDWVLLTLAYSYGVSSAREMQLEIVEYFEDGFEFRRWTTTLTAEPQYIGGIHRFSVGSPPTREWAPGRYYVYVYDGDRKVAEVEYEVIP